jgi:hypothetical protein
MAKVKRPPSDGSPDFADLGVEIERGLGPVSGKLLRLAGYKLEDDPEDFRSPRDLYAEIEELHGILASAAFKRIHLSSPFTKIASDLRSIKRSPRTYSSNKEQYCPEAKALLERHLLRLHKNKNTAQIFEIVTSQNADAGKRMKGGTAAAAAAALAELEAASRQHHEGESVDPAIVAFVELPITQSNEDFAGALRRWLMKEGNKPTRITQYNLTHSSVDAFLEIVLPVVNDIIQAHGGKVYSQVEAAREMSRSPQKKKK